MSLGYYIGSSSRKIPISQLRGYEYSQNRVQAFFAFGDVQVLTGDTSLSQRFVTFEDIEDFGTGSGVLEALIKNQEANKMVETWKEASYFTTEFHFLSCQTDADSLQESLR